MWLGMVFLIKLPAGHGAARLGRAGHVRVWYGEGFPIKLLVSLGWVSSG